MLSTRTKRFLKDMGERAGKSFAQGYFAFWLLTAGWAKDDIKGSAAAFDTLFTLNNVKAGVVMTAFSIATSYGSRTVGRSDSASLVE